MKNAKRPTCWNASKEQENSRNIFSRNTAYPINRKIHLLSYLRFHKKTATYNLKKIKRVQN
jgi:hypothetical protein